MEITFKRIPVSLKFTTYENGNTALVFKGGEGSLYEDKRVMIASADPGFAYDNIDKVGFENSEHYENLRDLLISENIIYPEVEYITPTNTSKVMTHILTDVGLTLRVQQIGLEGSRHS